MDYLDFLVTHCVYVLHRVSIYMSCQSSLCFSANTNSPLSLKFHRVWPLSPASFIYKPVIWNTMLMVCSPLLSVSTEPCGVANLSLQQCLEFDTQQNRVFSASGELITISGAPQISLSPLNHYIRLNVERQLRILLSYTAALWIPDVILMFPSSSGAFVSLLLLPAQNLSLCFKRIIHPKEIFSFTLMSWNTNGEI